MKTMQLTIEDSNYLYI